jgi:hypothetical protein
MTDFSTRRAVAGEAVSHGRSGENDPQRAGNLTQAEFRRGDVVGELAETTQHRAAVRMR